MPPTSVSPPSAPSLIYALPSILDRIGLERLFSVAQPLEVELGSGDGSFLAQYAGQHPERNFIGVERLLGRLRKLDRKSRRSGLSNVRGVRIESAYFLEYLLPRRSVAALHVYFPDPWPKRKHRRNRLVNDRFPPLAREALAPGGVVYLRTDDADYFEQMRAVFGANSAFCLCQTPAELAGVVTDFQRDFERRGIGTMSAAYRWAETEPGRGLDINDGAASVIARAGRTAAPLEADLGVTHAGQEVQQG